MGSKEILKYFRTRARSGERQAAAGILWLGQSRSVLGRYFNLIFSLKCVLSLDVCDRLNHVAIIVMVLLCLPTHST